MKEESISSINYKLLSSYILDEFPVTKWEWNDDSEKIIFKDRIFQDLFFDNGGNGLSLLDFLGSIKKEDQLKVLFLFNPESYEKDSHLHIRFRIENLNYNYHIIECSSQLHYQDGKITIKGFFRDITKFVSKINELDVLKDMIAERENFFRIGYWEMNPQSKKLQWSKELYNIYGIPEGSVKPSTLLFLNKIIHPEDTEKVKNSLQLFYKRKKPFNLNYRIVRPDGSLRNIQAKALIMKNSNGGFLKFMGASIDITEDKAFF